MRASAGVGAWRAWRSTLGRNRLDVDAAGDLAPRAIRACSFSQRVSTRAVDVDRAGEIVADLGHDCRVCGYAGSSPRSGTPSSAEEVSGHGSMQSHMMMPSSCRSVVPHPWNIRTDLAE